MADLIEHALLSPTIPPGATVHVEELTDRDALHRFLIRDRCAHAYLLGYLKPAYFQWCRWYVARDESGELVSLVCLYLGLSIPVVFVVGASARHGAFLKRVSHLLPRPFHFHVLDEDLAHAEAIVGEAQVSKRMLRMVMSREGYTGFGADPRVVRLGHRDTAGIMELYTHYPDNFFEPFQLETGLYYGIQDPESARFVSIAGVHVVSEEHDVAVIGNIVTHPEARGGGLARACVSRLLDALFERVSYVALNVQSGNPPAVKLFESFGFTAHNVFFEGQIAP